MVDLVLNRGDVAVPEQDQIVLVKSTPFNAETPWVGHQASITPTPLHFVRSNFPVPSPA